MPLDCNRKSNTARVTATAERGCNNTVTTAIDGLDEFAKLDFRARATP